MGDFYTDIHTHILPGVDDGAPDIGTAMEMLAISYGENVRRLFLTPHYIRGGNQYRPEELDQIFAELSAKAKPEFPDLELYLGNEILYTAGISDDLRDGKIHTMDGSRYVLVEFMVGISYKELYEAMKEITRVRYWPIIAHVERYRCLMKKPERIQELAQMGIYFQLNAEGLLGGMFDEDARWRRKLVKEQYISFLGSDAHNTEQRAPYMKDAVRWVRSKSVSGRYADGLTTENALAIIEHEYL